MTWNVSLKTSIKKLCTPKDASYSAARPYTQGHPMDLFLKISVLQANFCWLGDVEEIICPWKESVAKKKMYLRGFDV